MQTADMSDAPDCRRGPAAPPLSHLAFFDAGGRVPDDSPTFRAAAAGLLIMRLTDRWVLAAAGGPAPSLRELDAVRRAVTDVDPGSVREILQHLYETLTSSWGGVARQIPVVLCAYAVILKADESWSCAIDVYLTLISVASMCDANDMVPAAYLDVGYCYRMIGGHLAEAEHAYGRAGATAAVRGDEYNALLSRIGLANVFVDRGNLPAAQDALDGVIADVEARAAGSPTVLMDVLARARHDRGHVAYRRQDLPRAVGCFYAAVCGYSDDARRNRALNDLGVAIAELGSPSAARDAYMVAYRRAREPYVRQTAMLNLMRLAFLRDEETVFERFRQELALTALPAAHEAAYYQLAGEGLLRFGRHHAAREMLTRAVDVATRYQLNQVRIEAEALLDGMAGRGAADRDVAAARLAEMPVPRDVELVVRGLREMRECAGATW
jgi:tetratricopeptide (TPR) repeat protein